MHFQATPYATKDCELRWNIPETMQFLTSYGSSRLDAKQSSAYIPPFRPTWNGVMKKLDGISGNINATPGASAVVNKATCSNGPPPGSVGGGYGVAFVFKFADEVEQAGIAAGLSFRTGPTEDISVFNGPFLGYHCSLEQE